MNKQETIYGWKSKCKKSLTWLTVKRYM